MDEDLVRSRLASLRGAPILLGARGRPGTDLAALAALVVSVGRLLVENPDVVEVDLKPVIAGPGGAVAVDALVIIDADARTA